MSVLKKVVFVMFVLPVLLFFGACSKDKTLTSCQPTHIHFLTSNNEVDIEIQRNASGKITQRTTTTKDRVTGALITTTVDSCSYIGSSQLFMTSTTIYPDARPPVSITNNITLNADGYVILQNTSLSYSPATYSATYTYDGSGYLLTQQNSTTSNISTYSYLNGNLISVNYSHGGVKTFDYDLNKPNKSFLENSEPIKKGRLSANLVTNETYSTLGFTSITDYSYTSFNPTGYPLGMMLNEVTTMGTDPARTRSNVYDIRYVCE